MIYIGSTERNYIFFLPFVEKKSGFSLTNLRSISVVLFLRPSSHIQHVNPLNITKANSDNEHESFFLSMWLRGFLVALSLSLRVVIKLLLSSGSNSKGFCPYVDSSELKKRYE